MTVYKSVRIQIFEAIRDVMTGLVLSDASWSFTDRNVVSEPSEVPQVENFLSIRLITYNTRLDIKPHHFGGSDGDPSDASNPPTQYFLTHAESVVRIQCHGAVAWAWLDTFLASLDDDRVLASFRAKGFAVQSDMSGIGDISGIVGAREQTRGVANVLVGCRLIRQRVTDFASTISVDSNLYAINADIPAIAIPITVSLE